MKISAWVRTIPTGPEDHGSSPWSVWITTTSTTINPACASGTSIGRFSTWRSTTPPRITGAAPVTVRVSQDEPASSWEAGAEAHSSAASSSRARPTRCGPSRAGLPISGLMTAPPRQRR
ncbi:hypothetical protein [Brachybacterium massiliense]|uniref:hypothetical protein n=1 Tax=Brachybacterium massiliense TaxID=1755098 RepID=UPI003CCC3037